MVDFGEFIVMSIEDIRLLPYCFAQLPQLAIKGKLFGKLPVYKIILTSWCVLRGFYVLYILFLKLLHFFDFLPYTCTECTCIYDVVMQSSH